MLVPIIMKCRICGNKDLEVFLSLGKSPLANNFLSKQDLKKEEPKYPLELAFCQKCKLVQLSYVVPPGLMFKNYVYVTSTTKTFQQHFTKMADDISKKFMLNSNSLVVDIGSNDGLLLKGFQKNSVQVMGVEPAANVAEIARKNGVETINDFFGKKVVEEILGKKGHADIITANNVFAHIDDIDGVINNVKSLLKKDGIFIIEFQYLMDTIENMTFDNIYHEHLSYYTITSLAYFFKKHEMEIFGVQRIGTHGGSLRVFVRQAEGKHQIGESVNEMLEYEKDKNASSFDPYREFADKVHKVKETLTSYIKDVKAQGKSIAGYGAPAKSTTLLNFCNVGADCIDYIVEDNPLKIGLYTPGTHIPVVSSGLLDKQMPDYVLILAWNFAEEILAKTKKYAGKGVKFIVPLPEPKIV